MNHLPARPVLRRSGFGVAVVVGLLVLASCGDDDDGDAASDTSAASPESSPVREGTDPATDGVISREEAEQVALDAVGDGRVTWSAPEDDRGAAWEIEVTRTDGSEVDVLIAADGSVVKQVDKLGSGPPLEGPGTPPADGVVTQQVAEEAALAAVGEGQVTWVGREDERGAAWEVEITRPDGSEIDVLIAPDGSVID